MSGEQDNYKKQLEVERAEHEKTRIKLAIREHEHHRLVNSMSYKVARGIATVKNAVVFVIRYARQYSPDRALPWFRNRMYVQRSYQSQQFEKGFLEKPTSDFAVILHLFYPEMAQEFSQRLAVLSSPYDLYVSVPDSKAEESTIAEIKHHLPAARIVVVPNCGRDVLPFVAVMKSLKDKKYKAVLKLHSKKSLHRDDGDEWRNEIISALIPSQKSARRARDAVARGDMAVIGPQSQYVSGVVNFMATRGHLTRCITRISGADEAHLFTRDPQDYGFFSGTMFWANYERMMEIIDHISIVSFEPEAGQEDSTLAHALERLFTIMFELKNLKIGSLTTTGELIEQSYQTAQIPDWAKKELGIYD